MVTTAYFDWVTETGLLIGSTLEEIGELFEHDPWGEEVRERAALLINTNNEAQLVVPPEKLEDTHASFLAALNLFGEGAELILTWLDTGRDSYLSQSEAKMEEAAKLATLARVQMEEFNK